MTVIYMYDCTYVCVSASLVNVPKDKAEERGWSVDGRSVCNLQFANNAMQCNAMQYNAMLFVKMQQRFTPSSLDKAFILSCTTQTGAPMYFHLKHNKTVHYCS